MERSNQIPGSLRQDTPYLSPNRHEATSTAVPSLPDSSPSASSETSPPGFEALFMLPPQTQARSHNQQRQQCDFAYDTRTLNAPNIRPAHGDASIIPSLVLSPPALREHISESTLSPQHSGMSAASTCGCRQAADDHVLKKAQSSGSRRWINIMGHMKREARLETEFEEHTDAVCSLLRDEIGELTL
eukprot:TRINITY_DN7122_c0_g1_i1.p1 TRINITY_DN7122_c0_g1~~TRINITY_DN7122_c0_g1_i1.p1  ORF type:complete len:187 (+),score=13.57 TRINITY_DN7122_c0_g1_i1:132-692(+)